MDKVSVSVGQTAQAEVALITKLESLKRLKLELPKGQKQCRSIMNACIDVKTIPNLQSLNKQRGGILLLTTTSNKPAETENP